MRKILLETKIVVMKNETYKFIGLYDLHRYYKEKLKPRNIANTIQQYN